MHVSATEKEKKLTFDLKKEISGDFSKALLVLAEVCVRLLLFMFPSYLSCGKEAGYRASFKPQGIYKIYDSERISLVLQGQTGGELRSRSGEG